MASHRTASALEGGRVAVTVDTICIHGDTPGAAALAGAVRQALTAAGITVSAP